jgi:hypothetical protein
LIYCCGQPFPPPPHALTPRSLASAGIAAAKGHFRYRRTDRVSYAALSSPPFLYVATHSRITILLVSRTATTTISRLYRLSQVSQGSATITHALKRPTICFRIPLI